MNLPVAPPAFDATRGPRGRTGLGTDLGVGAALAALELIALTVTFWVWFVSAPGGPGRTPWGCVAAVGAVGAVAVVAAVVAARARALVTAAGQVVMAVLAGVLAAGALL